MTTLVLDVRANGNTGIARYGRRLLVESRDRLDDLGGKVYAVVRRRDLPSLRPLFTSGAAELVAPPDTEEVRYLHGGGWLEGFVADVRPELFYTTNYAMDQRYDGRFVVTIHDLIRLAVPETSSDAEFTARYGEEEFRRLREQASALGVAGGAEGPVFRPYFEALTRTLAARAHRVATVSAASAADIEALLGVSPDRISLVPSAVEEVFHPRDHAEVGRARDRLAVGDVYFVYVGLAGSHKRVDWLISRFLEAAPDCPRGTRLVIVGDDATHRAAIQRTLAAAGRPHQVVFTGWISDEEMAGLYSGAAACLSASVKEGFGLPPAEAMACGTEAIVTDIPSHREVLGPHAHYFGLDDAAEMRRLMVAAANGRLPARAPGYSPPTWRTASREFVATIRAALESM